MDLRLLGMACLWQDHDRPFPCKVHARLEACEEADSDPEQAQDTLNAFDAVSANPTDSRQESFFAFDEDVDRRIKDCWKRMFGGWRSDMPDDYYESVPSLHVELSLPSSDSRMPPLRELVDQWVAFGLGESGIRDIDVFRDPFDLEPEVARISDAPKPVSRELSKLLSTVFDMGRWPDAGTSGLDGMRSSLRPMKQLIAFDAGQGSATCLALVCLDLLCCDALNLVRQATDSCDDPSWVRASHCCCSDGACPYGPCVRYFDLGCGVSKVLQSGGSMLIVQGGMAPVTWSGCREAVTPLRAGGSGRNASGLIMRVRIGPKTRIGSPTGASLAHDAPLLADHSGLLEWISLPRNFLARAVHELSLKGES